MRCSFCPEEFATHQELESHEAGHKVKRVSDAPLTYLLVLPDGCTPGRWEAAEAFSEAVAELYDQHPGIPFQFVPFSMSQDGGADALLAIVPNQVLVCSGCGRKSWNFRDEGVACRMSQPDGRICVGRFARAAQT